jgi:3',5'-cyclic-AMP phosphodiesterase
MDVSTVAEDLVVLHDGARAVTFDGLEPDTSYELAGVTTRTLPRPDGELLCRFATVNDVHFGETEAGRIDDSGLGPVQRVGPGEAPYPETMNEGAVAEIVALAPHAVVAKGDLTTDGRDEEFEAFFACYGAAFGDRLHVLRGNHDAYRGQETLRGDQVVDLPGVRLALVDTVIPTATTGRITAEQIDWLGDVAAEADRPVFVMGHHQNWTPGDLGPGQAEPSRSPDYFGINPADSERLIELIGRQHRIVGYAAGHTHRNRVRRVAATGTVPYIEVACVKDFPGSWAEYRVYEGGINQVHHRISSPAALEWSERCRHLYQDFGVDYEAYALGRLEDRCFTISTR